MQQHDSDGGEATRAPVLPVIHVTTFPPEHCGIGEVTHDLVEARASDRATLILANQVQQSVDKEANVFRVWRKGDVRYPVQLLIAIKKLSGDRPALIHVQHHFFLYGGLLTVFEFPLFLLLLRLAGHRVLTQLHSVIELEKVSVDLEKTGVRIPPTLARYVLRLFYRVIGRISNRVIVCTEAMNETLQRTYRVPSSKIAIVPFGWRTGKPWPRQESKMTLGLQDSLAIVFHGFLDPTKGLEHLLEAFATAGRRLPTAKLLIVGELSPHIDPSRKAYASEIQKSAVRLGLGGRVIFTGYIDEAMLARYLSAADIIVLPYVVASSSSGSAVLAKVGAFGRPLIASRIPRFAQELEHGKTAWFVTPGNVPELASAIEALATNSVLSEKIGYALRSLAIGRSWERSAHIIEQVYGDVELI